MFCILENYPNITKFGMNCHTYDTHLQSKNEENPFENVASRQWRLQKQEAARRDALILYHKVVHHPAANFPTTPPTLNFMKTPPYFLLLAVVKRLGDQHLLFLCQQFGLQGQGWTWVAAAGSTNTSTEPSWLHFLTSHSVLFLSWTEAHSSHSQFSSYLLLFNSILNENSCT